MQKENRILSLDVFRGLTIMLMILVNTQGNGSYAILEHAPWDGCTLADLVFPFFLFIVGLTSVISLKRYQSIEPTTAVYMGIVRRSLILILLGVFLNLFPYFDLSHVRFYGILQRIGICYLITAFINLNTSIKTQTLIFFGILIAYWIMMTVIPVPGYGANVLTVEGNWVTYWDQHLFSPAHLLEKIYDPEGFLSTIPAIATTLSGVLAGHLLLAPYPSLKKFYGLMISGVLFLLLGWIWHYNFPINKNLWTSSYALWSSGWALVLFASFYFIIDILDYKKWALPLKIFGMNALFIFVFHVMLLKIQGAYHLKTPIMDYLFSGFSSQNASLLYGLVFLLLNFIVVAVLYRLKWFFRV